jgi:hypothetical protein
VLARGFLSLEELDARTAERADGEPDDEDPAHHQRDHRG